MDVPEYTQYVLLIDQEGNRLGPPFVMPGGQVRTHYLDTFHKGFDGISDGMALQVYTERYRVTVRGTPTLILSAMSAEPLDGFTFARLNHWMDTHGLEMLFDVSINLRKRLEDTDG